MEIISVFLSEVESNMSSLYQLNYFIKSSETYNIDYPDSLLHRIVFSHQLIRREVFFDFYPRQLYEMDIFIKDTKQDVSFSIPDYLSYGLTNQPIKGALYFDVDKFNLRKGLQIILSDTNRLFLTNLLPVLKGQEMIKIPSIDPRDEY